MGRAERESDVLSVQQGDGGHANVAKQAITFNINRLWNPPEKPLDPGLLGTSARGVLTREDHDWPVNEYTPRPDLA